MQFLTSKVEHENVDLSGDNQSPRTVGNSGKKWSSGCDLRKYFQGHVRFAFGKCPIAYFSVLRSFPNLCGLENRKCSLELRMSGPHACFLSFSGRASMSRWDGGSFVRKLVIPKKFAPHVSKKTDHF